MITRKSREWFYEDMFNVMYADLPRMTCARAKIDIV